MIDSFSGEYEFLSNFYETLVCYDGWMYPTSEHAYQAAKTLNVNERQKIRNASTPGKAKKIGRSVTLREDWEDVKIKIMFNIVLDKFIRHSILRQRLLDTGDIYLVEGNSWGDKFWGVCDGEGQNELGKILMFTRFLFKGIVSNSGKAIRPLSILK